jgi:hypothetical protein
MIDSQHNVAPSAINRILGGCQLSSIQSLRHTQRYINSPEHRLNFISVVSPRSEGPSKALK